LDTGSNKNPFQSFSADEIILREGENNTDLYKILSGHAELYLGYGTENEVLLGILKSGACFGEFGLLLHKPAPYTVVAYSDLIVYHVTEDKIDEFIRENHTSILQIMRSMANTMTVMQSHINQLNEELDEKSRLNREIVAKNKEMLKRYYYNR